MFEEDSFLSRTPRKRNWDFILNRVSDRSRVGVLFSCRRPMEKN